MARRLPTGIDVLDRQLDGGFPAGSVVVFEALPASQGELLLYELAIPRQTHYLTTDRDESAVADSFERIAVPVDEPDVQFLAGDTPLDAGRRAFRNVGSEETLVVDPLDLLERTDRTRYRTFLNELSNHMQNTNSVAILHCLKGENVPALRETTEHMADVVLDLHTRVSGGEIENRLAVPKLRGGRALTETIKLDLEERVRIDTSRDIA